MAVVAAMIGMTTRSVERANVGTAGPRVLTRLRAAASSGEVFDAAREERVELMAARYEAGLGIFDGLPARDAVSVAQLAREAEDYDEPTSSAMS